MKNVELSFTPKKSKYIKSLINKANIFWDYEDHPKDHMAISIYTLKRDKSKVFLGYLKKRDVEKNDELYYKALNSGIPWDEIPVGFKNIFTDEELEQVLKDIDDKKYNFTYKTYENSFLAKVKGCNKMAISKIEAIAKLKASEERLEKARLACCRFHTQKFKEGTHDPECETFQKYFKMALEYYPHLLVC